MTSNVRLAFWALGCAGLLILLWCGWFIMTEPGRERAKADAARVELQVVQSGASTAIRTEKATETALEAARASDALTGANHAEILSTPGAEASVGPVNDAGLRSLCRRPAYRADPRCRSVPGS